MPILPLDEFNSDQQDQLKSFVGDLASRFSSATQQATDAAGGAVDQLKDHVFDLASQYAPAPAQDAPQQPSSGFFPLDTPAAPPAASSAPAASGSASSTDLRAPDRLDSDSDHPTTIGRGRQAFLDSLTPAAQQVAKETGLPASVLLAIPANETGWGTSVAGNNLYGIKGSNPDTGANTGPVNTWEDYGNGRVDIKDTFRAYSDPIQSMRDFARFLQTNTRYAPALQAFQQSGDPDQLVKGIHAAGYATDPDWSTKINSIAHGISGADYSSPDRQSPDRADAKAAPAVTTGGAAERTSQFALGLSDSDAYAACGPAAAIAFANTYGRNPTASEAVELAKSVGWTNQQGMAGVASEQALLDKLGVKTRLETNVNWDHVASDVQNGNPVILDTPGHYFYVNAYDPSTGKFKVGTSGTDLRGGSAWMTSDQINATKMGAVRAALYADNPQAHGPSVSETKSGTDDPLLDHISGFLSNVGRAKDDAVKTASQGITNLGDAKDDALRFMGDSASRLTSQPQAAPDANPGATAKPVDVAAIGDQLNKARQAIAPAGPDGKADYGNLGPNDNPTRPDDNPIKAAGDVYNAVNDRSPGTMLGRAGAGNQQLGDEWAQANPDKARELEELRQQIGNTPSSLDETPLARRYMELVNERSQYQQDQSGSYDKLSDAASRGPEDRRDQAELAGNVLAGATAAGVGEGAGAAGRLAAAAIDPIGQAQGEALGAAAKGIKAGIDAIPRRQPAQLDLGVLTGATRDQVAHVDNAPPPAEGMTRLFTGTGSDYKRPLPEFDSGSNLVGPGLYATDDPRVAGGVVAGDDPYRQGLGGATPPGTVISQGEGYAQTRALENNGGRISASNSVIAARVADDLSQREDLIGQPAIRQVLQRLNDMAVNTSTGMRRMGKLNNRLDAAVTRAEAEVPGFSFDSLWGAASRATVDDQSAYAGANVRAVDIPKDLHLLDYSQEYTPDVASQLGTALEDAEKSGKWPDSLDSDGFYRELGPDGHANGEELYTALEEAFSKDGDPDRAAVNDFLHEQGYDGIKYPGGRAQAVVDEHGEDILHNAYNIFYPSLNKVYNGTAKTVGGQAETGFATRLGGAAVGGAAGNATTPDDATPEERALRIGAGAAAGLAGGHALAEAGPAIGRAASGALDSGLEALDRVSPPGVAHASTSDMIEGARVPGQDHQPTTPFAQAANDFLDRARGTDAQNAELRPDEADHLGNMYSAGFSPETQKLIESALDANNEFAGARQGVITDPEMAARMQAWAKNHTAEELLGPGKGANMTPEQIGGLRYTLDQVGKELDSTLGERFAAQNLGVGTWTDAQEALAANQALVFQALTGRLSGASADAGRALRSFQQKLGAAGANEDAVKRAIESFAGNTTNFNNWLSAWRTTDPTDYAARYKLLGALKAPSLMDKAIYMRMSDLMSGPNTAMVVSLHGAIQSVTWPVLHALRGDVQPAAQYSRAFAEGVVTAGKNAWEAFTQGIGPETARANLMHGEGDITAAPFSGPKNLANPYTWGSRTVGALHEFFRTMTAAGFTRVAAEEEAARTNAPLQQLLANPTPGLLKRAQNLTEDAMRGTNDGKPGVLESELMKYRSWLTNPTAESGAGQATQRAIGLAAHAEVPFVMIPSYLYRNGLKIAAGPVAYPMLAAKHGLEAVTGHALEPGFRALSGTERDQRGAWGRGDLGVAMATAGVNAFFWQLAQDGNLTADGPSDPTARTAWEDAGGQPHSIRIGGHWVDANTALGPFAVPAMLMASVNERKHEADIKSAKTNPNGPTPSWLGPALESTVSALSQMPMIRPIGQAADALKQAETGGRGAGQWMQDQAANLGSSFIPASGLDNFIGNASDTAQKTPENVQQAIESRLPGLKGTVPNKVDAYGRDVRRPVDLASVLPGRPQPIGDRGAVADEIARLAQAGNKVSLFSSTTSQQRSGGKYDSADQTPAQMRDITRNIGQEQAEAIRQVIGQPDYASLPDDKKTSRINQALSDAKRTANLAEGDSIARDPERGIREPAWGKDDPVLQAVARYGMTPPNAPQEMALGPLQTLPFTPDEQQAILDDFHNRMAGKIDQITARADQSSKDPEVRQLYLTRYMQGEMRNAQAAIYSQLSKSGQLKSRIEARQAHPDVSLPLRPPDN